jgi:hypothetical protein
MTMEDERNLDLLVAELETENRLMRARNERPERELNAALDENARFKVALERIIAVSQLAFRDSRPQGIGEMGPSKQDRRHSED